ncbi:MAG TPA: hypothetical protein VGQ06_05730 [Gemmatimonadales bacterium]|nr:hypothetical protein [Gemmatimonadales bacterium]
MQTVIIRRHANDRPSKGAQRLVAACALIAMTGAPPAAGQGAPATRYRASPDTTYFQGLNVYRMYAVRAGDTLGAPVHALSVERHRWRGRGGAEALELEIDKLDLDVQRGHSVDTLVVRPDGRVLTINGRADTANPRGRYDALPRLPAGRVELRPGIAWTDTFSTAARVPAGDFIFKIARRARVTRIVDTLGRPAVEVVVEGTVRYRDAYWTDSAAGRAWWIDVQGPMTETFWFDQARGRLLGRSWSMDLTGRAGFPDSGRVDTVPAGLRSTDVHQLIDAVRARLLARPLPQRDTLITTRRGSRVLLHTSERGGDTVQAALARNDGLLGTARLELDRRARPRRYEAVWTDSTPEVGRQIVERWGDTLLLSGQFSRRYEVPDSAWTIADHGLPELLVPVLLSLPADSLGHRLRVFRPYLNVWDEGRAALRRLPEGFLALVQMARDTVPTVYLIGPQGDLLLVFRRDLPDTETGPPTESARHTVLTRLVQSLQRR